MDVDLAVSLNPNQVSPGLLGFLIVCALGVLVWLLCRNMGKHLNRLENDFVAGEEAAGRIAESIPAQAAPASAKPGKSGKARKS
jgi:hypothetical protein